MYVIRESQHDNICNCECHYTELNMEQQVQEGTHSIHSYIARSLPFGYMAGMEGNHSVITLQATTKQRLCLTLLPKTNLCTLTLVIITYILCQWPNAANTIWTCRKSHKLQAYCNMQWTLWLRCMWSCHVFSQPVITVFLQSPHLCDLFAIQVYIYVCIHSYMA